MGAFRRFESAALITPDARIRPMLSKTVQIRKPLARSCHALLGALRAMCNCTSCASPRAVALEQKCPPLRAPNGGVAPSI